MVAYLVRSGSIWLGPTQHEECHERQSVECPDEEASELYETDDVTGQDEEQCEQALQTKTEKKKTFMVNVYFGFKNDSRADSQ